MTEKLSRKDQNVPDGRELGRDVRRNMDDQTGIESPTTSLVKVRVLHDDAIGERRVQEALQGGCIRPEMPVKPG